MKKLIAGLLVAVMLLGCVPLSGTVRSAFGTTDAGAASGNPGYDTLKNYILENYDYCDEFYKIIKLDSGDDVHCQLYLETGYDKSVTVEYDAYYKSNSIYNMMVTFSENSPTIVINFAIGDLDTDFDTNYFFVYSNTLIPEEYSGNNCEFWISGYSEDWEEKYETEDAAKNAINAEANRLLYIILTDLNVYLKEKTGVSLADLGFTVFSQSEENPQPIDDQPTKSGITVRDMELRYKGFGHLNPEIAAGVGTEYTVKYESSDPSVVKVSDNGNVEATGVGKAVITCTVTDSSGNASTAECTVTVKYNWWQWLIRIFLLGFLWY